MTMIADLSTLAETAATITDRLEEIAATHPMPRGLRGRIYRAEDATRAAHDAIVLAIRGAEVDAPEDPDDELASCPDCRHPKGDHGPEDGCTACECPRVRKFGFLHPAPIAEEAPSA